MCPAGATRLQVCRELRRLARDCQGRGASSLLQGGALTLPSCPRPHVCAEQELTLVGRQLPCVQAFSRVVPVWKPGCRWQAWCVSHERRYVLGTLG